MEYERKEILFFIQNLEKKRERKRADGCEKVSAKFAQSYFHCIVTVFDKQWVGIMQKWGTLQKFIAVFLPIMNRTRCRYDKVGVHNRVSALIRGEDNNMKFSKMEH